MKFVGFLQKTLTKTRKYDILNEVNEIRKDKKVMVLEFSCSNHRSIKEKITFSAIASNDDTNEELLYQYGNIRVLKNAVIYGANGSGKSNLISAIVFMKRLVTNSINNQPGTTINQQPHKISGFSENSEYNMQFVTKGIRYAYGFSLNNTIVVDEYLYSFPKGRQVKIFERNEDGFLAGDRYKGKFDSCKDVIKPNRLFLSCAANFSAVKDTEDVFSFFKNDLIDYSGSPRSRDNWMHYSLTKMNDNSLIKETVLTFLKGLDTGINDIVIDIEKKQIEIEQLPPIFSEEIKNEFAKRLVDRVEAKVVYNSFEVDLMKEESTGIKKLIEFLCPFIDIIINGKVLICDEIETNFHEAVLYYLVDIFKKVYSPDTPQMFFTTHDTSILDLSLFRRDQIWFTEMKRDERSTDLYSLSEIKNVRKDENVGRGYISGKYGAIPMLNENLASLISRLQLKGDCND